MLFYTYLFVFWFLPCCVGCYYLLLNFGQPRLALLSLIGFSLLFLWMVESLLSVGAHRLNMPQLSFEQVADVYAGEEALSRADSRGSWRDGEFGRLGALQILVPSRWGWLLSEYRLAAGDLVFYVPTDRISVGHMEWKDWSAEFC